MGPISGEFGSLFVGVNLPTIFASFRSESACCWNCSILQKQPAGFVLMLSPGPAFQDLRQLFQLRLGGPGPGRGACALGSCKARMATGSTRHRRFESLNLYHLWGYGRGPRRDKSACSKKSFYLECPSPRGSWQQRQHQVILLSSCRQFPSEEGDVPSREA